MPRPPPARADAAQEEIFSSSFAAAAYFEATDFPKNKKVYVVGEVGIQQELDLVGVQHIGGPADVRPPDSPALR